MRRICKYCGKQYDGDPGGSCCPACAAAQRKTTLRPRTCTICGSSFLGGPSAKYCPPCRRDKQREAERRYKRVGTTRPLGSTDICEVCGGPYIVASGKQKYCPTCAPEAIRKNDNAASRRWNAENTTPDRRKAIRQAAAAAIPCAVCGKPFVPHDASVTCSEACRAEYTKLAHQRFEATHQKERNAYHRQRTKAKEAAMTPEEYTAYRQKINAQARVNYRKRKEKEKQP